MKYLKGEERSGTMGETDLFGEDNIMIINRFHLLAYRFLDGKEPGPQDECFLEVEQPFEDTPIAYAQVFVTQGGPYKPKFYRTFKEVKENAISCGMYDGWGCFFKFNFSTGSAVMVFDAPKVKDAAKDVIVLDGVSYRKQQ